ncbi:ParA family protein [Borreliella bissettiae]|uniref:ParA family protein n=1 Tax=Borrelia bissettiae TaxID=64897 RepID=UPI001E522F2E|nr:ParA family protein [Borreliella bissettiae]MCD2401634.1 ParA family protein [Borreliella bissettiae]
MDIKKSKIITIANIKGGVGKSTSAIVFSILLSQKYKVLLIDMDTQASTTSYFNKKIIENKFDLLEKNIYKVLKSNYLINDSIINVNNGLDLLPSYLSLHAFSEEILPYKTHRLKDSFKYLKFNYDYIIIDTNPHLDSTLSNALVISGHIIVPMTAEKWAIESLQLLEFFINKLKLNLKVFLFATKFKKNKTHKDLLGILQKKSRFLGIISEREDLNRRIAKNDDFDLDRDYIKEYLTILNNFNAKA